MSQVVWRSMLIKNLILTTGPFVLKKPTLKLRNNTMDIALQHKASLVSPICFYIHWHGSVIQDLTFNSRTFGENLIHFFLFITLSTFFTKISAADTSLLTQRCTPKKSAIIRIATKTQIVAIINLMGNLRKPFSKLSSSFVLVRSSHHRLRVRH